MSEPSERPDATEPPLRVLAIDGGGVRGILAAGVLQHVEDELNAKCADVFDLIAGTSAGALIAALLATPKKDGTLRSARDVSTIFKNHARRIFPRHPFRGGPGRPFPYDPKPLAQIVSLEAGYSRLCDCNPHVIVPAYDMAHATPFLFDSRKAEASPADDYALTDVVSAAIAAPFYFPPHALKADEAHQHSRVLIDGGIFANNPTLVALACAQEHYGTRLPSVLSVSTGAYKPKLSITDEYNWNDLTRLHTRVRALISVVLDASSDTVTLTAAQLLGKEQFHRIDPALPEALDQLDHADSDALEGLLSQVRAAVGGRALQKFLLTLR